MADDCNAVRIQVKPLRSLSVYPPVGILEVRNDLRQLGFGGQTVIDGDYCETGVQITLQLVLADAVAVAADKGSAMDPEDDWADFRIIGAINVEFDLAPANGLINHRVFFGGSAVFRRQLLV